jgi:hypothetical protein
MGKLARRGNQTIGTFIKGTKTIVIYIIKDT